MGKVEVNPRKTVSVQLLATEHIARLTWRREVGRCNADYSGRSSRSWPMHGWFTELNDHPGLNCCLQQTLAADNDFASGLRVMLLAVSTMLL